MRPRTPSTTSSTAIAARSSPNTRVRNANRDGFTLRVIRSARLVANPGCYATAVQLALLPLVETDFVDHVHLIADAKSGVSGAGRKAEIGSLFAEASDNFKAYAVQGHRHHPEILVPLEQQVQPLPQHLAAVGEQYLCRSRHTRQFLLRTTHWKDSRRPVPQSRCAGIAA